MDRKGRKRYPYGAARHRVRGQSIPLIALMLVVLIAMVGLAVDVGNTFAEERKAVAASNAAALAGMNAYIKGGENVTHEDVYDVISSSLKSNGYALDGGGAISGNQADLQFTAEFLDSEGKPITEVNDQANPAPTNATYIRVNVNGTNGTFFARLVNRPTLPVNAKAYAGFCPSSSGIYPLAVSVETLDLVSGKFREPLNQDPEGPQVFGTVTDDAGLGRGTYTWRRLDVKNDPSVPGGFSWLRWYENDESNVPGLVERLAGDGNISEKYEEVTPWPGSGDLVEPENYPNHDGLQGQLSANDWIWGDQGYNYANDIEAALDYHISKYTRMTLPIYDETASNGSHGVYHVQTLGVFVLKAYGQGHGDGKWIELYYLGDASTQRTACAFGEIPPVTHVTVTGQVSFKPQWEMVPEVQQPVQWLVVLDVSGSMNASFEGNCKDGTKTFRCANSPSGSGTGASESKAWKPKEERRIYVAKQGIEYLISMMNLSGNPGFSTTRPPDEMALVWFESKSKSNYSAGWSSDKNALIKTVRGIKSDGVSSSYNEGTATDPVYYVTNGGTNGGAGLARAATLYQGKSKEKEWPAPGGQKFTYRQVVIFVTDGVSNQFFNANNPSGGYTFSNNSSSDTGTYPNGHPCKADPKVIENAGCQTNNGAKLVDKDGNVTYDGKYVRTASDVRDRPITAMINVSQDYLKSKGIIVASIALSSISKEGLQEGVPTNSSYYYEVPTLLDANGQPRLNKVMEDLNTRIELGDCTPGVASGWVGTGIDDIGTIPSSPQSYVELVDATTGQSFGTAPIVKQPDGTLRYTFTKVPIGKTYTMVARLYFQHVNDRLINGQKPIREYSLFGSEDGTAVPEASKSITTVAPNDLSGEQDVPIFLALNGAVCATGE